MKRQFPVLLLSKEFQTTRKQRLTIAATCWLLASQRGESMSSITTSINRNNHPVDTTFDQLRSNPREVFLLDGGTGEELFRNGVTDDRKHWSATALMKEQYHPIVQQVHRSFLVAGSNAVTTNSYGVIPGVGFTAEEISTYGQVAGKLARSTVDQFNMEAKQDSNVQPCFVLGSLGPLVESYRADMIKSHDEGMSMYKIIATALAPFVDIYIAETMSCIEESSQAIEAIAEISQNDQQLECTVPRSVMVSYTLDSNGCLRDGETVTDGIRRLLTTVMTKSPQQEMIQLLAILFNCSEPEAITKALEQIKVDKDLSQILKSKGILLGAYANRLTPVASDWTMADSDGPQPFRKDLNEEQYWNDFVSHWIDQLGLQLVGGCCGITPEHIGHLNKQIQNRKQT